MYFSAYFYFRVAPAQRCILCMVWYRTIQYLHLFTLNQVSKFNKLNRRLCRLKSIADYEVEFQMLFKLSIILNCDSDCAYHCAAAQLLLLAEYKSTNMVVMKELETNKPQQRITTLLTLTFTSLLLFLSRTRSWTDDTVNTGIQLSTIPINIYKK